MAGPFLLFFARGQEVIEGYDSKPLSRGQLGAFHTFHRCNGIGTGQLAVGVQQPRSIRGGGALGVVLQLNQLKSEHRNPAVLYG